MCIYIHIEKDIYVDAYISLYEYNLYEQIIFIIHAYLFICIRAEYGWGDTHKISMYKVLCCMGAKWTLGEHLEWCWFASPSIPIWHMGKGSHNSYGGHCINPTLLQSYFQEKVKVTSRVWLFTTPWQCSLWNSPSKNTGVGSRSLLQGIFPAQGSNPGLQQCRWILYQLSHQQSLS